MFDARASDDNSSGAGLPRVPLCADGKVKKPVAVILHQELSSPGHIGQWFQRNGHALDVRKPRFGDPLPRTLDDHCGAVIFGGPQSANDPDAFIKQEIDWIGIALRENKPFLGVCLGAQMLAKHLGAKVDYHPEAYVEIGYHPIEPTPAGRAFAAAVHDWPEHFYQWHREGFEMPCGGTALVCSEGPFTNQAFSYGSSAVGVQFHPEITYAQVLRWSGNPMRLLMRGAKPRIDHIHGHMMRAPIVHAWLDRFLAGWTANILPLAQAAGVAPRAHAVAAE